MKVMYLDCFSGISGDMFVGAMLDAGLNFSSLQKELSKLGLNGYKISKKTVLRNSIRGTKFDVLTDGKGNKSRSLKEILAIIDKSRLNCDIKQLSKKIFLNIANAEAEAHDNKNPAKVHFHEVGNLDSILDIVGATVGIKKLGIDKIYGSVLNLGKTAPAAMNLLKGYNIVFSSIAHELVTPTGAAIFKTLVGDTQATPSMRISSIGYGAGSNNIDEIPNFLRVVIGEAEQSLYDEDKVIVVETNIDDMKPIMYDYVIERLSKAGALDVFITPIHMKKSRIGILLSVLTKTSSFNEIVNVIFGETTTIGLRYYEAKRFILKRRNKKIKTRYGSIDFKISRINKNTHRFSPEYEDCKRLARKLKVPLQKIYQEALKKK